MFLARPRAKQFWPNNAACWSPAMPAMGMGAPNKSSRRLAIDFAGGAHLGQHLARHVQHPEQFVVPGAGVEVEQHGARGVAGIGDMQRAAGEIPQQPGVNGAEGQFAPPGALPGAGHVIQNPAQLAAGEIGVNDQAGLAAGPAPRARRASVHRRTSPCAGPARRWRCGWARRSGGPRPRWSRADW